MNHSHKAWLETQAQNWVDKGWITAEARKHICTSYEKTASSPLRLETSLYTIAAVVGLSLLGMAAIWGAAHIWYHISAAARVALAVVLLLLSQAGIGMVMMQDKEGSIVAEGMGLVHCLVVLAVLGIMSQTFYLGWSVSVYIAAGAVLCLPAMYLLRSLSCFAVYALIVLGWVVSGGAAYVTGGSLWMWLFLALAVPFYHMLVHDHHEKRLACFSWIMTAVLFLAFMLAAAQENYIPFLLLSALAAAVILSGQVIAGQQSWGAPFRWMGRLAAAAALLISCLPAAWYGIADIRNFHWTTTIVTVILCAGILVLMGKSIQKRIWSPAVYAVIPFLLGAETIIVRSGVYSSVPLVVSAVYLLILGFYEIMEGFKDAGHSLHLKFGILILLSLIGVFLFGSAVSVLTPTVAIVVLVLVMVQIRRVKKSRQTAELRTARRARWKQTHTVVREDTAACAENAGNGTDTEAHEDVLPEWMKDIQIPVPKEPVQETLPSHHQETVIPKEKETSLFVPPVFHAPDDMPVIHMQTASARTVPQNRQAASESKANESGGSPWQDGNSSKTKREKHFSHSPWSHEGGSSR